MSHPVPVHPEQVSQPSISRLPKKWRDVKLRLCLDEVVNVIVSSVMDLIGNTPLMDVSSLLPEGSARLLAKLEMMNPGGSIKDRPALAMIEAAEQCGDLKPGMTLVEPTAGNTGIGLALIGNLKGYRTVFFVPDRMSAEKIMMMKLYGAEVHLVDKAEGMPGCIERANRYMEEQGNCYMPQQFKNPANPDQAETRLGPEIYRQLGGYPDGLALGGGTGGTFSGLARWLKKHNPAAVCWLVQPVGSVFCGGERGSYEVEGIGNSFIPDTLDLSLADRIVDIPDEQSFKQCKRLVRKLGLTAAGSAGANLEACIRLCAELGEGKTVVTVFPDSIERYLSKDWAHKMAEGGY